MADRVSPFMTLQRTRERQVEALRYRIAAKVREMTDVADLYAVLMTIQRREREAADGCLMDEHDT